MRQEFIYGIPIVVILSLITVIASDYCRPLPITEKFATVSLPSAFDPLCYLASLKPEAPEFRTTTTTTSNNSPLSTVTYSGTANSGPSTSTTTTLPPSPSFEA